MKGQKVCARLPLSWFHVAHLRPIGARRLIMKLDRNKAEQTASSTDREYITFNYQIEWQARGRPCASYRCRCQVYCRQCTTRQSVESACRLSALRSWLQIDLTSKLKSSQLEHGANNKLAVLVQISVIVRD